MGRLLRGASVVVVLAALVAFFYRAVLFQGLILGDYDAFVYFYPLRQYAAEALRQGRIPLWNPYLFAGAPFFANLQTAVLYPPNLLFLWLPTPYAYTAAMVVHVLLAGVSMYLFARRSLDVSRVPGLMAAIAFMFSGFISGQVGHINQLTVSAWLPLLLVVYDEAVRRRSLALGMGVGLVGTLQFLAGHTQEWYFSTAALGLFALWRVVRPNSLTEEERGIIGGTTNPGATHPPAFFPLRREGGEEGVGDTPTSPARRYALDPPKHSALSTQHSTLATRLRPLAYLALAGLVEAGTAAVQVLPTLELSQQSIRSGGMPYWDGASFSLPPSVALYTILPGYPTELFSEYVGYVGVIPLVLALVAVAGWVIRPVTVFMIGLGAIGFLMALGGYNPLFPILYEWVPGLDMFRVPARWLLLYTFGVAGLAGLGAQLLLDLGERRPRSMRRRRHRSPASVLLAPVVLGVIALAMALFYYLASPRPTLHDLETWAGLAVLALAMVALALLGKRVRWVALGLLALVAVGELWTSGENTAVRHPIPFEAYMPARSSTSFLLDDLAKKGEPGRLLSFATDSYEVKETPDYKKEYAWINPEALVSFLVNVKLDETLTANLPLEYGIETVDGYDGGVLPLKRYAELKSLLLPVPGIPPDNPLRLNLVYAPPLPLLDLFGVRYLLGTKLQDTQVDNVYYDRGISLILEPDQSERLQRLPDVRTTAIGIISSTEGAREQVDGVPAAELVVTDSSGQRRVLPIRLGMETGETPERDGDNGPPAHHKPRAVAPFEGGNGGVEYYAKIPLPDRVQVKEISVKDLLPGSKFRLRAVTLIDDVAATSAPLVLSDRLDRELFFDMKLYTVRDPLPRAFLAHESMVRGDGATLEALRQPKQPLDQVAVLAPSSTARTLYRSAPAPFDPGEVRLTSYSPEEVTMQVSAAQDGYLVLRDVFFPGWTAEVDGVQVPIERADYLFRAVFVERGSHTVVFKYVPASFRIGLQITLASLSIVLLALAALAVRAVLRRRHASTTVV